MSKVYKVIIQDPETHSIHFDNYVICKTGTVQMVVLVNSKEHYFVDEDKLEDWFKARSVKSFKLEFIF